MSASPVSLAAPAAAPARSAGSANRRVLPGFRLSLGFTLFYLALIVIGAGTVIIPGAPLLAIIFYSQVANGFLLPIVLVLMLLLINNRRLMGRYVNGIASNSIAWVTVIIVAGLTLVSTVQIFFPGI